MSTSKSSRCVSLAMSVSSNPNPPPQTQCKRLFEAEGLSSDLSFNLKRLKVDGGRSFPEKRDADESNEHDLRTLTEVIVETKNNLNYPRFGYRTNCGEANGKKCFTNLNEGVSSLGETGEDCGLKDVALEYDTNIKVWIDGGDNEPRIDDQNPEGSINLRLDDHKECRGAKMDGVRSFLEMCGATFDDNESNEHNLRTLAEVAVQIENYLNYSSVGHVTNCVETRNWVRGFTDLNDGALSLGEIGQNCGLKDVALKYVTNIKIWIEGGDSEPKIVDHNWDDLVNFWIFDHKEGRGAKVAKALKKRNVDGGRSFTDLNEGALSLGENGKNCGLKDVALKYVTSINTLIGCDSEPKTDDPTKTSNWEQGFTDLNVGALSLGENGKNCGLKDVALKYVTNINTLIGGDSETKTDDQNREELVNLRIFDHKEGRGAKVAKALKNRKVDGGWSFPEKCGATFEDSENNENDLRTLTEVTVETGNLFNYSGVQNYTNYTNCGETGNGDRAFTQLNEGASSLGETRQDCDLKDVALMYDTNIKTWIEGGDTEPRINRSFPKKCGAIFENNKSNEHDLRTLIEVTVETGNYLNYSSVGYSTNSEETNGDQGFTDSKDCGLKDVALKYDTNIKIFVAEDITGGKERIPIPAINGVDYSLLPTFTYVSEMIYPSWYKKIEPAGCICVRGCYDSRKCLCLVKNKGEIPYNENGCIMKVKARVHECGPKCKCPPTCMNRVSQFGPRIRLEVFKTENRGWGVRSPELIQSGGFVCEYLGEFMREKDADLRVGGDEYLFDVYKGAGKNGNGYSIDAGVYGNVGRFFNHSCSPNMYAQKVTYDHDDHRMPHIMLFATRDIPPMEELCYDYNYRLGTVCDADGNIKIKECHCGSRECKKRLY